MSLRNGRKVPDQANEEHPFFHLELASSTTPNQLWEQILVAIGDALGGKGRNEAQRFARVCASLKQSEVTLIIFDEIQHLISYDTDRFAWRVTEAIKRLLNAGIAPIVLSGDESATALFKSNAQLRNRMRIPLRLKPLDHANLDDVGYASVFLDRLDKKMVEIGIVKMKSNLVLDYENWDESLVRRHGEEGQLQSGTDIRGFTLSNERTSSSANWQQYFLGVVRKRYQKLAIYRSARSRSARATSPFSISTKLFRQCPPYGIGNFQIRIWRSFRKSPAGFRKYSSAPSVVSNRRGC